MDIKHKEYTLLIISCLILLKSVLNIFVPDAALYETIRGYFERQARMVAVMGEQLTQNGIGEALISVFSGSEREGIYQVYSQGLELTHNGG